MNTDILRWHLKRAHHLPEAFDFFRWQCFPLNSLRTIYYEIEGGIAPLLKSGPRKGKPNWRKVTNCKVFHVTPEEYVAIADAYEKETGNCTECAGRGEVFARWAAGEGTTYKQCHVCSGMGKCELAAPAPGE